MAPGMRQANDFLMALQLGNAAKASSLTSLQIRLPAVVIGGGLTGVDTATEVQAYYISQVEKMLARHDLLAKEYGEDKIQAGLDTASREILAEFLQHGLAVRKERAQAKAESRTPNFIKLIREWGGVTIAYRRSMQESPAYINNHEELKKALEEGIYYLEGMEPHAVDLDEFGHTEKLICKKRIRNQDKEWVTTDETVSLPARSVLVATGTSPNTAYEFEHRGTFHRLNLQYQHYEDDDGQLDVAHGVEHCKDPQFGPFTSYLQHDKRVSLIGDTHPVFHGNVVKAIASGLRTYPKILDILRHKINPHAEVSEYQTFAEHMNYLFTARITRIERKTADTIELSIQAPLAVSHFKPGQFFRLQNFETLAPHMDHTLIQMEPLALVGAECNHETGTIDFIVQENSATSKLCAILKRHEPVSLMGPTGVRSRIPEEHETVLIIGGPTSLPFLRSYGAEMRKANNRVLYVGQFNQREEVYCRSQMEHAADVIVYQVKQGERVEIKRHNDCTTQGNDIINGLLDYAAGSLNAAPQISLHDIDRVFVVGGPDLLREFQAARKTRLKSVLIKDPKVIGSVYGNMQCMLKGVCAQCLQWQIDPETGQRTKAVFACSWQDQPLEIIDIDHIDARQMQNRLHDHISKLWVDHLFSTYPVSKI
jgi:NAD(P)H-flavin reductase